ncbi:YhcN/YlaJ family sporulation lipoprotein [Cohnella cholangitidis]|uniref:YhcN/YlaJ family sporulation lipoprotein n=1 Tax=Cohnella cholangitidis TaxID=2598458 RepID=A0A7G5BUY1_9BACL|nr:YhcN/YlaJ family sporulation lipoprotein [Cohnella cholangitidis]QMV40765.1 YhcN/YlaJ family sporulation lipoprotein [Cohnella cholangitidis]
MRKGILMTAVLLSSAIALSGCMQKTGDLGNKNIRPNAVRNNNVYGNGLTGNGMTRMRFANDQDNEQNRMYGIRRENNNVIGMHGNSRIETSDKIANKIAAMPGIDSAYVMMTDHNAYVAVTEDNRANKGNTSASVTDAVKDKIADQVKTLSPSVENVYVSANPDFTGRMKGYANDVRAGHPIQGFLAEFNALVERVFPAPSGTRNR